MYNSNTSKVSVKIFVASVSGEKVDMEHKGVGYHESLQFDYFGKTVIPAILGRRYIIVVERPETSERILVNGSIDGKSFMNGRPAACNSDHGYVMGYSKSRTIIDGWRTSMQGVNNFDFSDPSLSYAGKTTGTQNVGVISISVFAEKERMRYRTSLSFNEGNMRGGQLKSMGNLRGGAGTAFGEASESHTHGVDFEGEKSPQQVIDIYYDTPENLGKMGIVINPIFYSNPYPKQVESSFCQAPD